MEPEKKSSGALVGLVIIIIILVVGGLYVWNSKIKNTLEKNKNTAPNVTEVTLNDSAELDTLEQDLNTTDIDIGANAVDSIK